MLDHNCACGDTCDERCTMDKWMRCQTERIAHDDNRARDEAGDLYDYLYDQQRDDGLLVMWENEMPGSIAPNGTKSGTIRALSAQQPRREKP